MIEKMFFTLTQAFAYNKLTDKCNSKGRLTDFISCLISKKEI